MHPEILDRLLSLSRHGDIPHLLFHGPRGSGKTDLVRTLLSQLYGPGATRVASEKCIVTTASSRQTIEIDVRVSNYHIEIRPSDVGANDRYVVQHVIKEMANNGSIAAALMNGKVKHKTIVLVSAGDITKQAQAGLRRTMETFSGSCRLVLVTTFSSRVIEPLRSRCVSIRVPLPRREALLEVVAPLVAHNNSLAERIVDGSGRSIARAMFMAKQGSCEPMAWVKYVNNVCTGVFLEQSPCKVLDVRESFVELLAAGVPATLVLKTLMHGMLRHESLANNAAGELDIKRSIVKWAAVDEHRLVAGSRRNEILHLEAFVATVMDLFKKRMISMFGRREG